MKLKNLQDRIVFNFLEIDVMKYIFFLLIIFSSFLTPQINAEVNALIDNKKVLVRFDPSKSADNIFEQAKKFIGDLGARAINTLTSKDLPRQEREDRFEKIFEEAFDLIAIAKFVLGRYRRTATEEEKQEFLKLFKKSMSITYADRFSQYTNEMFEITDAKHKDQQNGLIRVISAIKRSDSPDVKIEWNVIQNNNKEFKIVDVIVEDISMSITQRQEYSSIIEREGGTVSGLNRALQEKVKTAHQPVDGLITSQKSDPALGA